MSVPFRGGWLSANRQFLSQLPIRRINFDDASEKKQHDAIVALVEEMLQLQREYAEETRQGTPHQESLERRIAQVDNAIDAAVYRLYGLTEEEIAIVENKT